MIQGLYAAATGMMALEQRHEVIANNISNVSTPGFRRQGTIQKGFDTVLLNQLRNPLWLDATAGPGGGLKITETYTDFSGGPLRHTSNALDVALHGPGYIAVETPDGERFTRNGALTVDGDGQLATSEGYKVQNVGQGAIDVMGGTVEIDRAGQVFVDGRPSGKIRLVEFEEPSLLIRAGNGLFATPAATLGRSVPAENTTVLSESLEMANVQVPYELVQMMLGLRAYGANQRVINALDETMSRLIEQVGMPA